MNNKDIQKRKVKRNQEKKKDIIFNIRLTNPCIVCGETNPLCLEFDHDIGNKDYNISNMVQKKLSTEHILDEIAKCRILCANCHSIKTAIEQKRYSYLRFIKMTESLTDSRIEKIKQLVDQSLI